MTVARRLALAAALAVPFWWGLGEEEFHGDESHWTSSGQQAFYLVGAGRWRDRQWTEEFYFWSQPQVGKLLIGASLAAAGHAGPIEVYDYDWQRLPDENRAAGRVPGADALVAARIPGAIAGWVGCLLLWALTSQLGAARAGPLAAVLLASQPLWLANARRAGLDAPALTLGLGAALAASFAARQRRRAAWLGGWFGAGALLGLAAGTKYVGVLTALAGLACVAPPRRRRDLHRLAGGVTVALATAAAAFVATNPAAYGDPLQWVRGSFEFLTEQAEGMRQTIPEFRSPLWVAVEIFGRAIWPISYPHVVERSMREPLAPGTYGTPVVALGAAVALVQVRRQRAIVRVALWVLALYVALAFSLPTWWERWHLPLVTALVALAAAGLALLPRGALPVSVGWSLAAAQYVAALALLPSFLSRGFGHLVVQPVGAVAHLAALAYALATLVSLALRDARTRGRESIDAWPQPSPRQPDRRRTERPPASQSGQPETRSAL